MTDYSEIIREIRAEYDRLDKICYVNTSKIAILISTRMTRKLGCFEVKRNGLSRKMTIKISFKIIDDPELFLDVIRHEYAHVVVYLRHPLKKLKHDAAWKNVCKEIGCVPRASRKIDKE